MTENQQEIALITGAGRGIGRAIAIALAESGRHVLINFRTGKETAQETLDLIEANHGSGELAPFDVTDHTAVNNAIEAFYAKHARIDILVNNAGMTRDGLLVFMKEDDWQDVIDTNLTGFYNVTRPIVKQMLLKRSGRIVNIASTAGQIGSAGQVNYSASKAGLIGATQALAREIAKRKITVNAVAPGFTDTDMIKDLPIDDIKKVIPMQRIGTPEEVASAVVYLCSPLAGYITGQVLGVNGGIC